MMKYGDRTAVDVYLGEVSKIPLLTSKEEQQITRALRKCRKELQVINNKLAAKKDAAKRRSFLRQAVKLRKEVEHLKTTMIRRNCRLVVSVARKYQNYKMPLSDLIEEGNIGLIRAVDKFDPTKGYKFSTFAIWWIKQQILKAIKDKGNIIRIPIHIDHEFNSYRKDFKEYISTFGREPSVKQLLKHTSLDQKRLNFLLTIPQHFLSINTPVGNSTNEVGDLLEDTERLYSPTKTIFNNSLHEALLRLLSKLNEKESFVIKMRFGLSTGQPMVLDTVGEKLGVTRERVRQIQSSALAKLKKLCTDYRLNAFLN